MAKRVPVFDQSSSERIAEAVRYVERQPAFSEELGESLEDATGLIRLVRPEVNIPGLVEDDTDEWTVTGEEALVFYVDLYTEDGSGGNHKLKLKKRERKILIYNFCLGPLSSNGLFQAQQTYGVHFVRPQPMTYLAKATASGGISAASGGQASSATITFYYMDGSGNHTEMQDKDATAMTGTAWNNSEIAVAENAMIHVKEDLNSHKLMVDFEAC